LLKAPRKPAALRLLAHAHNSGMSSSKLRQQQQAAAAASSSSSNSASGGGNNYTRCTRLRLHALGAQSCKLALEKTLQNAIKYGFR
jgi:hypothetical protein